MKLSALLTCLQLSQTNGNSVKFELEKNGEAGEKYDQQLISYLSRFGEDDDDSALNLVAKDRLRNQKEQNPDETIQIRKIRQLKAFIISQMDPKISASEDGTGYGRYCYYGCHCLPGKSHNDYPTFGKPVDKIDEQCKIMGTCYKCLVYKYGEGKCDPDLTNYAFSINEKTKAIDCSMNRDPCKRDVCECDRQFATNVSKYQHSWNEQLHIKRAGFDRYAQCREQKEPLSASSALSNNGMGFLGIPGLGFNNDGGVDIGGNFGGNFGGLAPSFSNILDSSSTAENPVSEQEPDIIPEGCCNLRHFPDVFVPSQHHSCCGTDHQVSYNTLTHQCCFGKVIFKNEVCM